MRTFCMLLLLFACVSIAVKATDVNANLTSLSREMLDGLCPYVDICDPDATTAELKPNGVTGNGFKSCCQGCSCHPDCKKKRNCCHPDEESNEIQEDPSDSMYKCMYTRITNPNNTMMDNTPSYRIVVSAPINGCVSSEPKTNQATGIAYRPSCDETNVVPWGSFFPTFSKGTGEIYKNLQCAYCHGANDAELFTPVLVCEKFYGRQRKMTSLNEQLQVFLTGKLSPKCHIDFFYKDTSLLQDQRCFTRIIDTCLTNAIRFPFGQNAFEFDFDTVSLLCEKGLRSPVTTENGIYRNVFCTICGQPTRSYSLTCEDDALKTDDVSFTQVFDPRVILQQTRRISGNGKGPEVCLLEDNSKEPELCRSVHCPSGKIRDKGGKCIIVSTYLSSGGMMVQVKLTPIPNENPTEQLKEIGEDEILASSVWPSHWKPAYAYRRVDESECSERAVFIVYLATELGQLETILDEFRKSLKKHWVINVNDTSVTLRQSLFEYSLVADHKLSISKVVPYWQKYATNHKSTTTYHDCDAVVWRMILRSTLYRRPPFVITKLFLCQQVQLEQHEFELGYNGYYLQSNMTKRVLHQLEFDLIEVNGGSVARVCLSDTIFAVRKSTSGTSLNIGYSPLLLVIGTYMALF